MQVINLDEQYLRVLKKLSYIKNGYTSWDWNFGRNILLSLRGCKFLCYFYLRMKQKHIRKDTNKLICKLQIPKVRTKVYRWLNQMIMLCSYTWRLLIDITLTLLIHNFKIGVQIARFSRSPAQANRGYERTGFY